MKRLLAILFLVGAFAAPAVAAIPLPAPVPVHRWSCADVPFWVKGYSSAQISSTAAELGMTQWQILRLLRCFPKTEY
jgi:hypothetical protein